MANNQQNREQPKLDPAKAEYLEKLNAEKATLASADSLSVPLVKRLLEDEIDRVQTGRELNKLVEVHSSKPAKLSVKVLIPVKQFPKFNFVGKLLGPKGNSLKRLQEDTGCKMAILGRGSMRDQAKEEECRQEGGKFAHLREELHVLVEAYGLPPDNHQRMVHAMNELTRFLSPDNNDDIRQQQMEEMMFLNGGEQGGQGGGPSRGRGRGRGDGGPPSRGRGGPSRGGMGGAGPLLATPSRNMAPPPPSRGGRGGRGEPRGRAPPSGPPRSALPPPHRPSPMSRAQAPAPRAAPEPAYEQDSYYRQPPSSSSYAEDSYSYDDPAPPSQDSYDPYSQQQPSYSALSRAGAGSSDTEFYDYGHGSTADDGYGDSWTQNSSSYGKSHLGARSDRSSGQRQHPYSAPPSRAAPPQRY